MGNNSSKILVLGVSGMLGHTLFSRLFHSDRYEVRATARKTETLARYFPVEMLCAIDGGVDADNFDAIIKIVGDFKPNCVINCIGIIKQLSASAEHIPALSVNSLFPHRLAILCKASGARLVHISSDCVFDGIYRGKYLGEAGLLPHGEPNREDAERAVKIASYLLQQK